MKRGAVFLDRDGVLIEDADLLVDASRVKVLAGVPEALQRLKTAGYSLIVVSNQAVVARGRATEAQVREVNERMQELILTAGGPALDGVYFCPHHPQATVAAYRVCCECRKPNPGMILEGARDHEIDLAASFMVGDRPTDILAGIRAGCRTIWVQTGRHEDPPIQSPGPTVPTPAPTWTCADLPAAVDHILSAG